MLVSIEKSYDVLLLGTILLRNIESHCEPDVEIGRYWRFPVHNIQTLPVGWANWKAFVHVNCRHSHELTPLQEIMEAQKSQVSPAGAKN